MNSILTVGFLLALSYLGKVLLFDDDAPALKTKRVESV